MTPPQAQPPRWLRAALMRLAHRADRECLVADLDEEFRLRTHRQGARRARRWYRSQALRSGLAAVLGRWRDRRGRTIRDDPRPPREHAMSHLVQDLRYGARALIKTPTFTVLTVAILGLAIGMNTAIFSMFNVLLIEGLPIRDTEQMAWIYSTNPAQNIERAPVSPADFLDYRRQLDSLENLAAVNRGASFVLTGLDEPLRVDGFTATANLFQLWGIEPVLGRLFAPGDDELGAERVAVLSHGAWQRHFGADPGIVGSVIRVDGHETTIVGVVDPELEFGSLAHAEIWVPLRLDPATASREARNLWVQGRRPEGVTLDQVHQEVANVADRLAREHPDSHASWQAKALGIHDVLAADDEWMTIFMLGVTVAFVMAIACANVATMMFTRAATRSRELAVRVALGARRRRIVAQLLTESALLSVAAALVGVGVARVSLQGLMWIAGDNSGVTNFFALLELDRNVLLFTGGAAMLAPLLFGFLPALRASRPDLVDVLKEGSRGSTAALRGHRLLVTVQVALALTLLVSGGMMVSSIIQLRTTDWGIDLDNLLTLRVDLPAAKYSEDAERLALFEQVAERVRQRPDVVDAGWIAFRPAGRTAPPRHNFRIEGRPVPRPEETPSAGVQVADEGGLQAMRLPLLQGRHIERRDDADGAPVVLVNQELAARHFPDGDPLGQRIRFGSMSPGEPWREIVGVVGNIATGDRDNPASPTAYLPLRQSPRPGMALLVRTRQDPLALAGTVRELVWAVDAEQPVGDVRSMEQLLDDALAAGDAFSSMFLAFAAFALLMAAAGLYGVISFSVARRRREIGVRMALGASAGDVLRMIGGGALRLVAAGLVLGGLGAWVVIRLLAGAIFGFSGFEPTAIAGVVAALAATALLGVWVPARRATAVDPVTSLRPE